MALAAEGYRSGTPAYRRLTLAMLCAGFATFSLLYAVQPLLPLFAHDYRLSAAGASLAVSLATGPLAIGILVAGMAGDRLPRRPVMVAATLAASGLTLAAAVAPDWRLLLALRLLTGVALAGVPAVAMAYLAEEIDGAALGEAMGLYVAGTALGGMGGRLIASLVADVAGWRWALGAVGIAGLAAAEAFRRLAPPSHRAAPVGSSRAALGRLFRDPALPLLYLQAFLLMGTFVTVYNYTAFRLLAPPYRLSQAWVGAVFLLYVLGSASSVWFGGLAGRLGRRRVFAASVAVLLAGVAIAAATPLPLVVLGIGVVTVGFFGAHSIASAWVGRRAVGHRGPAAALYLFFYYLGSSVLGSAGGLAWASGGWPGVTWFCAGLGLLALAGAAALARVPPLPAPERPTPPAVEA